MRSMKSKKYIDHKIIVLISFISGFAILNACEDGIAYESSNGSTNELNGCQNEGEQICDSICVNLLTDRLNCGQCDQVCPDGLICEQGACSSGICNESMGEIVCEGSCVTPSNNDLHCGACNRTCTGGSHCITGLCECGPGLDLCIDACVNLNNDIQNCGECSAPCRNGLLCVAGECKATRPEVCNGEDDDLDSRIDENDDGTALKIDCGNLCGPGEQICQQGEFSPCTAPKGSEELCDMQDNDCDGLVDEGISQTYYADRDRDGFGSNDIMSAVISCMGNPSESGSDAVPYVVSNQDCNDQNDQIYPNAPEGCDDQGDNCQNCDQIDNNCDGSIDEGCTCMPSSPPQACGSDIGICQPGVRSCMGGVFGACEGVNYRAATLETCNQLDDDCDAQTDEGMAEDLFEVLEQRMSNDRCDVAHNLAVSVSGEDPIVVSDANLNHTVGGVDTDWYVLQSTDSTNVCLPFISSQCVTMEVKFTHPVSVNSTDYELCIHQLERERNACDDEDNIPVVCISQSEFSSYDAGRRTYTMSFQWQGQCGRDDSRYFALEVFSPQNVNSCDTYDISISTTLDGNDCPSLEEEEDETK
jgi:hypothetical protein